MAVEKYGRVLETENDLVRGHDLPGIKEGNVVKCTHKGENIKGLAQLMEGANYCEFRGENGATFTVHVRELRFHG